MFYISFYNMIIEGLLSANELAVVKLTICNSAIVTKCKRQTLKYLCGWTCDLISDSVALWDVVGSRSLGVIMCL